ncbi:4326_t:CDS:2 [Scutellospora calospora]|uniref:4326_t:CDS:1 n=1 Tax=Scutellospora calospora TaxID=85575 RepID=A0ACA9MPE6_9GLOM|nr:4326_t:CDS:2 [Scutellospora calospora]
MKFDDIKKNPNKNKKYLLERLVGLANNCAHYPNIHAEYMKFYEKMILYYYGHIKNIRKRVPIKTYSEVMKLQYRRQEVEAFTLDMSPIEKAIRNMKKYVILYEFKFTYSIKRYTIFDPNSYPICKEFIIEYWIYINANMPESLGEYMLLVKESPFSSIISPQKF